MLQELEEIRAKKETRSTKQTKLLNPITGHKPAHSSHILLNKNYILMLYNRLTFMRNFKNHSLMHKENCKKGKPVWGWERDVRDCFPEAAEVELD